MSSRHAARWDRIDARPRRYVLGIGPDHVPKIHNCDGCDVTQCKLARSLYDKGEWVRMIDVGQHGYVTMIEVSPKPSEEPANAQRSEG